MRAAGVFLLLLFSWSAPAQTIAGPTESVFPAPLAAHVFATAYAFMAPRTLEPVSIPRLAIWLLHGFAVLDPSLSAEQQDDAVVLRAGGQIVLSRPAPGESDASAWGDVTAALAARAWEVSALVRRGGAQGLIRGLFDELFTHLDPYSRYSPPGEIEIDRQGRRSDGGLGLILGQGASDVVIQDVLAGSPAARSGVPPGASLIALEGEPLAHADPVIVAAMLAGPPETHVRIVIRTHEGRRQTLDLVRALVPPQTVFASTAPDDLLILRLTGFQRGTSQQLVAALDGAFGGHTRPRGLVLDLRGNRGGFLQQSVDIVGALLGSGLIATTAGRDPAANRVLVADAEAHADDVPVAVLVDGRTASAAEITAAALADNRRAVVIGSATLGKGLMQTVTTLPDGGELYVTWSRVLAPLGWPIQDLGVFPQLCTSLGAVALAQELDALDRGDRPLAQALAAQRTARAPVAPNIVLEIRSACPAALGTDADIEAAHYLLTHPVAYGNALLPAQFLPATSIP